MIDLPYPNDLLELLKLEKMYPDWNKTPPKIRKTMLRLAFSSGGIDVLNDERFINCLLDLSSELNRLYADGTTREIDHANDEICWLLGVLYEFYSKTSQTKRKTQREYAKLYVNIREHIANEGSSVNRASKEVAEKLNKSHKTTRVRYYELHKKYRDVPLDEIKSKFRL